MAMCMCVILMVCIIHESVSAITETPLNAAVVQGSAGTLDCSSNISSAHIQWYNRECATYSSTANCQPHDAIYDGFRLTNVDTSRFSVTEYRNSTIVTVDININPTQLTDAGVYQCKEILSPPNGQTASSQLIVLESNPACTTNLSSSGDVQEYDVINMECIITYNGSWAPVMRWYNSVTQDNFTGDVTTVDGNSGLQTVTSQLTVVTSASLNGAEIVCQTYFTQSSSPLQTNATNIPSYTYTWTSPTFNVIPVYTPRNMEISPNQSTYYLGDRLQCSADGNPTPSYYWTDLVSGNIIQRDVLVITVDMLDHNFMFQCTATNYFNWQFHSNSSNITFMVTNGTGDRTTTGTDDRKDGTTSPVGVDNGGSERNSAAVIGGVVGAVCAAILIAVIVLVSLLIYRRRKLKSYDDDRRATRIERHRNGGSLSDNDEDPSPDMPDVVQVGQPDANAAIYAKPVKGNNKKTKSESPNPGSAESRTPADGEPKYGEVMSVQGPVARPQTKPKPQQATAIYAPIVHPNESNGNAATSKPTGGVEPVYGEVVSRPGPVARPRSKHYQQRQQHFDEPAYAPIVHTQQQQLTANRM